MNSKTKERYPNDPTEYVRTDDFLDSLDEEQRHFHLTDALAAIRHGELQPASGSAEAEWIYDKHGVKIYVLVGYEKQREVPVLITGWPAVYDPRQAVQSGRWREKDLREIHQFNGGSGDLEDDFHYP